MGNVGGGYNPQGNNGRGQRSFSSLSGLQQSNQDMSFMIETAEVKKFLQKRFTRVDNALKQKGLIQEGEEIEIDLISLEPEKTFIPFALILPIDVLDKPKKSNRPSVFNVQHSDGVWIKEWYYELFSSFLFDKNDAQAFRTNVWRNAHGIRSYKTTNMLHRYATPKILGDRDGEYDAYDEDDNGAKVVVIIDPVRIFHKMLEDTNNMHQKFYVTIKEPKKIDSVNYLYPVQRTVLKKKGSRDGLENKIKKYLFGNY